MKAEEARELVRGLVESTSVDDLVRLYYGAIRQRALSGYVTVGIPMSAPSLRDKEKEALERLLKEGYTVTIRDGARSIHISWASE